LSNAREKSPCTEKRCVHVGRAKLPFAEYSVARSNWQFGDLENWRFQFTKSPTRQFTNRSLRLSGTTPPPRLPRDGGKPLRRALRRASSERRRGPQAASMPVV